MYSILRTRLILHVQLFLVLVIFTRYLYVELFKIHAQSLRFLYKYEHWQPFVWLVRHITFKIAVTCKIT